MTVFKEEKDIVRIVLHHSDGNGKRQTGEENMESGDQSGNHYDDPERSTKGHRAAQHGRALWSIYVNAVHVNGTP